MARRLPDGISGHSRRRRWRVPAHSRAVLFLAFALPCFLFVRERARARRFTIRAVPAAVGQVVQTFRGIRRFPGLGRFLIGRVFYTDAVNTVIAFMGIYVINEVGFSTEQSILIKLVATVRGAVAFPARFRPRRDKCRIGQTPKNRYRGLSRKSRQISIAGERRGIRFDICLESRAKSR